MKVCRQCNRAYQSESWRCPGCGYQPEAIFGFYLLSPELQTPGPDNSLGFQQDSFAKLFELEENNFWFRSRNKLIIWALAKYFKDAEKILEVGCGTGYVLSGISKALPGVSLTGSDISSTGLAYAARRLSNAELVQFDAASIPYDREFDVTGAFDVLEHVEDDQEVIRQIYKATTAGGGLIITVPQHRFLWSSADEQACHKRRYSNKLLSGLVVSAGFEIVKTTSFVSLLLPAMYLSRLVRKSPARADKSKSELNLPGYINYPFEKILDLERILIKAGLRMPCGGSLLLIARKP